MSKSASEGHREVFQVSEKKKFKIFSSTALCKSVACRCFRLRFSTRLPLNVGFCKPVRGEDRGLGIEKNNAIHREFFFDHLKGNEVRGWVG